ncbi:CoA transferase [Streptomyces naphthomycinicus]|uniref:CoA transferase n=1 Tax=Streptomyces naphthomycinicus TaxID=2872625 RepID=UPI001CED6227|nr:CoA transferase [Streptomyces sp. TML10]
MPPSPGTVRSACSAHPAIVPYRALRTGDGHLMVAARNDKLWRALAETIRCGEPADDARGRTMTRLKATVSVTGQE